MAVISEDLWYRLKKVAESRLLISTVDSLIQEEKNLIDEWEQRARPEQRIPPGKWRIWLILAGRGFGKTRTGAESLRYWLKNKDVSRVALIGATLTDVRNIMLEGASGLLTVTAKEEKPAVLQINRRRVVWENGSVAYLFSGDRPDQLRGSQFEIAWVDELAKFRYPQEILDQLALCLRIGTWPRLIITTTPKPLEVFRVLLQQSDVVVTRGSTFANAANLSTSFLENILRQYENTRLGAQELYGDILSNEEGALWRHGFIRRTHSVPELTRIVIAIDPAVSYSIESNETGIIVAGIGKDQCGYILEDLSGRYAPSQWVQRVIEAYYHYKADRVVAEINQGGALVEQMIRLKNPHISYKGVYASRGKTIRAEPIAALYEQERVFHCASFGDLEQQMLTYVPGIIGAKSPDRLDALVWALTELMVNAPPPSFVPRACIL